ncbi:uncharacterized protein J3R85_009458, partial [Psidium guajava]
MSLLVSSFVPKTCTVHAIPRPELKLKESRKQRMSVIRCGQEPQKPPIKTGKTPPQHNDLPKGAKPDEKESKPSSVQKAGDDSNKDMVRAPAPASATEATE